MARNVSVERFKKLTEDLQKEVHALAVAELNAQARDLAQLIASVAPVYQGVSLTASGAKSGTLKSTVKVVPGKKDTIVRIVAGGTLTIRPSVSSKPYDYARADEFGTVNMRPRPFFFPTYRLRKKKVIASMKRKIAASIKKRSAQQ
jgi:HK97 gp10 family phage protein